MDNLHKQLAVMAILGQRTMMALVDMLVMNLQSEEQEVRDWALDSLKKYGELRRDQMASGNSEKVNDTVLEFLKSLNEPEKIEEIIIGFSLN